MVNIRAQEIFKGISWNRLDKSKEKPSNGNPKPVCEQEIPGELPEGHSMASFFYINDLHSALPFMPVLKKEADEFDEKYKDITTFKVSGGDMKAGTGRVFNDIAIDFMNSINLDLTALGNHDLDCGVEKFAAQLPKLKKTKYIATNLYVHDHSPLNKYFMPHGRFNGDMNTVSGYNRNKKVFNSCIVEKNGERYGFVGMATADPMQYRKRLEKISIHDLKSVLTKLHNNNNNIKQILASLEKPNVKNIQSKLDKIEHLTTKNKQLEDREKLQKEIDNLRAKGINKIILLSHLGTGEDEKLVSKLDGIDIVIEGHDHNETREPVIATSKTGEPVLMVQAGSDGKYAGILNVVFDEGGRIKFYNNNLKSSKSNSELDKEADEIWKTHMGEPKPIAQLKETFWPFMIKEKENPLVNIFAEAMLAIDHKKSVYGQGADVALMLNMGNLRKKGLSGVITERDILEYNSYGDRVYKMNMTGKQLLELLKYSAHSVARSQNAPATNDNNKARLIHSSNLFYTIDLSKKNPDEILSKVKIADPKKILRNEELKEEDFKDINPHKKYKVILDTLFVCLIRDETDFNNNYKLSKDVINVLRKMERTGNKPKGYEDTEIYTWDRADAQKEYIKYLSSKKVGSKSLLDVKLNNTGKITIKYPDEMLKARRRKQA